ncbi:MAG: D-alanine--D-alanine ligase [Holosporales bacterium]|jgi:D-alanine-D-alanine ligase|nr:D-alanine--D-alanine ligase [Holosporales bacterium]
MNKITVLKGGWSSEREISLRSGENIANTFRSMGYEVYEIDIVKNLRFITDELYRTDPDYIYNALHGTGGEDGILQGVLEIFGKPYSHSGVLGSSIAFHKAISKILVKNAGGLVIEDIAINKNEIKNIDVDNPIMEYPFVVKPCANGSSVGVFIIHNKNDLLLLQNQDWIYGDEVMIEKYINGREFTVYVNDGVAVGAIEILPKNEFFDYSSKYDNEGAVHIADYKNIEEKNKKDIYELAEISNKACVCKGTTRVDLIFDGEKVYFLEINTQPGMTPVSLVPDIAKFNGIKFEDIIRPKICG